LKVKHLTNLRNDLCKTELLFYTIVACGEHGPAAAKLVNAIDNGKRDIRTEADYNKIKVSNGKNGDAKVSKNLAHVFLSDYHEHQYFLGSHDRSKSQINL
jgi:uncharacterized phage-associated protein